MAPKIIKLAPINIVNDNRSSKYIHPIKIAIIGGKNAT